MGTAFRVYPQMKTMGEVSFLAGVLFARRLLGRRDDPSPFFLSVRPSLSSAQLEENANKSNIGECYEGDFVR
jgi:hypothetical protein